MSDDYDSQSKYTKWIRYYELVKHDDYKTAKWSTKEFNHKPYDGHYDRSIRYDCVRGWVPDGKAPRQTPYAWLGNWVTRLLFKFKILP